MSALFGKKQGKEQLLKRVGDVSQVCGIDFYEFKDGRRKGVDAVDFRTGSGFRFVVLPGRGMDIGLAEYRGVPLCWKSSTGETNPSHFEPEGYGWLRSFFGGMLTTCGLTYIGKPCTDNGKELGLHGRISNIPASHLKYDGFWQGDEYVMYASGKVRETSVFGDNLELTRTVSTVMGGTSLVINDTVENLGHQKTEHMIMYHINVGYPVLSEDSVLRADIKKTIPRNEDAARGMKTFREFPAPVKGYVEQCFYHTMAPDRKGMVTASIFNKKLGLGVYIKYPFKQLPYFVEWKMVGEGIYVVGIEPCNAMGDGRDLERREHRLQFLNPGEKRSYQLEVGVLER